MKYLLVAAALVGAAVLSGAPVAQAHSPATSELRTHAGAARAAAPAHDPLYYSCAGKPDGNYPYPGDDTKMISCVNQIHAYVRDCPQGLHFDPEYGECD
ncbi:chitin binding peritrophin-A domain-containing protein [Streptomyces sp. AGS-58]|uniref:chitin binding peritrophin-A domain-containing protein n=1 Tax=unclassified Streptomyces TaxID=2593676 RepID=UPI0035A37AE5